MFELKSAVDVFPCISFSVPNSCEHIVPVPCLSSSDERSDVYGTCCVSFSLLNNQSIQAIQSLLLSSLLRVRTVLGTNKIFVYFKHRQQPILLRDFLSFVALCVQHFILAFEIYNDNFSRYFFQW